MRVAAIQLSSGNNKKENIDQAMAFTKKAISHKAELIALPEVFHFRGTIKSLAGLSSVAERIPGESTAPFLAIAKKHKVWILAGSVYEKVSGERKVYNTSILISPAGKVKAKYRKIHLFEANVDGRRICESDRMLAGNKTVVTTVNDFKAGLSICFDVRFSDLYQVFAKKNVSVVFIPSAFTHTTGKAHWEVLLRSRAIESQAYIIAPNQCGRDDKGLRHYGHSMIIDPWGKILAEASENKPEIIYTDIDKQTIIRVHHTLPINRKDK